VAPVAQRLTSPVDRQQAGRSLQAMGPMAEREVAKYLDNPDRAVREEAVRVLKGLGSKENVELSLALADLKSADAKRRQDAARRLEKMPVDNERRKEVAQALEALLEDTAPGGGPDLAAKALVVWATKDNVPALIKALDHQSAGVRHPALEALGKLKDERSVEPVARRLTQGADRTQAVKALQALGPPAEKEALKYLQAQDKAVRIAACHVLQEVGTKASVPALQATAQQATKLKQKDVLEAALLAAQASATRP
jgi:HEAT repeat protein